MSTALLDAPARTIHPLEQAVLDYLDEHPGSTLSEACDSIPSVAVDEDFAVILAARLLWHRRLPLLMVRTGADRMWFGMAEAVALARRLLFEEDEPVTCGGWNDRHTPECATGQDECPEARDERVMDAMNEQLADSLGMRY